MARGATNSREGGLKYLNFVQGLFRQRVDENTEGAKPRKLKSGDTVHELTYDTFEGQIVDIKVDSSGNFGDRLAIKLDVSTEEDPNSFVLIQLPFSSAAAKGFLKRVEALDFTKDVVLKGYDIYNKDKERSNYFLVPYQNGKIEPLYTKDNPNGLPELQKIKVKGKVVWDDSEQLEFFKGVISSLVFAGATEPAPEVEVEEGPEEEVEF